MGNDICQFEGQEYIVWDAGHIHETTSMIPTEYGVFPNYGGGTDAYCAIRIELAIEGDNLVLNEITVRSKGNCYFPIAGVMPLYPEISESMKRAGMKPCNAGSAAYRNLGIKIVTTGSLILLKDQIKDSYHCVSGFFDPSDFAVRLKLEFIGGKRFQETGTEDSLATKRNIRALSLLENVNQSRWIELEDWMRKSYVIERTREDNTAYWSAIEAGEQELECQLKFPGFRKPRWSDRELEMVRTAAHGKLVPQDAFDLLCLFEKAETVRHKEEREFALAELLKRDHEFWKQVETWMEADLERWPHRLYDVVRHLAGADIEADREAEYSLNALVYQFETRSN